MTDAVLFARGLAKEFSGFLAVQNVDISIRRGSVHAIIGPNGAGKTTCFNLLSKFLEPTRGTIIYDGIDVTKFTPAKLAKLGLIRSFQISAVFQNQSVLENVLTALHSPRFELSGFLRNAAALGRLVDRAQELIAEVGLERFADTPARGLSYGRRRTLEIATTLAMNPKVMLLDEPTAGMGHEDIDRIVGLIKRASQGRTVLIVEHNLSVVENLCDRITVMARGAILAEGTYDEVSKDSRVIEAYLGAPCES